MDKIDVFISKIDSMAWIAKRFAEEQQLKDAEEDINDDRSDTSSVERPYLRPRRYSNPGPRRYAAEQQYFEDGLADHTFETGSLYEVDVTRRPPRPRNDRGNRYHSNRYYRDDDEYRSMKFGEEIGTRCLRKLKEKSNELRKLVRELRELSNQVPSRKLQSPIKSR
jgi:hypothetical protein